MGFRSKTLGILAVLNKTSKKYLASKVVGSSLPSPPSISKLMMILIYINFEHSLSSYIVNIEYDVIYGYCDHK